MDVLRPLAKPTSVDQNSNRLQFCDLRENQCTRMQLESIFLNMYNRCLDNFQMTRQGFVEDFQILELDLRFNVILFGIVRLDQVRSGIETMLRFSG